MSCCEIADHAFGHHRWFLSDAFFNSRLRQDDGQAGQLSDFDILGTFSRHEAGHEFALSGHEQIGVESLCDFVAGFEDREDEFGRFGSFPDIDQMWSLGFLAIGRGVAAAARLSDKQFGTSSDVALDCERFVDDLFRVAIGNLVLVVGVYLGWHQGCCVFAGGRFGCSGHARDLDFVSSQLFEQVSGRCRITVGDDGPEDVGDRVTGSPGGAIVVGATGIRSCAPPVAGVVAFAVIESDEGGECLSSSSVVALRTELGNQSLDDFGLVQRFQSPECSGVVGSIECLEQRLDMADVDKCAGGEVRDDSTRVGLFVQRLFRRGFGRGLFRVAPGEWQDVCGGVRSFESSEADECLGSDSGVGVVESVEDWCGGDELEAFVLVGECPQREFACGVVFQQEQQLREDA